MRQAFIPFGGYRLASRSEFPNPGNQGFAYLAADTGMWYLFWDGRYEPYGGNSSGGAGEHADLPDLLPDGIDPEEANHITDNQLDILEDLELKRPQKPVNLSPEPGEIDVLEMPTFLTTGYYNAYSLPMYGLQLRIFDEDDNEVFDSGVVPTVHAEYLLETGVLQPGARVYKWQMAHIGSNQVYSEWSDLTTFTTAEEWPEQYIDRPTMLLPTQYLIYNSGKPSLLLSTPSTHGGVTPGTRNFKITADPQGEMLLESGTSATDFYQAQNNVERGQLFYAFGQHTSEAPVAGLKSKWSFGVPFSSKELFREARIGLCLVDDANWIFQRIDRNYMPIDVDSDYWLTNPIWQVWMDSLNIVGGQMQYTDVDGQKMIRIPKIWIRSGKVPKGPLTGKRFWLIDPTTPTEEEQADGWHIHACFAHPDGGYQDSLLVSAYMCSVTGGVAYSVNAAPFQTGHDAWVTSISARNTNPSDPLKRGWKPMPYYVTELFKLLGLLEFGGTSAFYFGVCSGAVTANATSDGYRGIKIWNRGNSSSVGYAPKLQYGLLNNSARLPGLGQLLLFPFNLTGTTASSASNQSGFKKIEKLASSDDGAPLSLLFDDYLIPMAKGNPWASTATRTNSPNSMMAVADYGGTMVFGDSCIGSPDRSPYNTDFAVPSGVIGVTVCNRGYSPMSSDLFTSLMVKYD